MARKAAGNQTGGQDQREDDDQREDQDDEDDDLDALLDEQDDSDDDDSDDEDEDEDDEGDDDDKPKGRGRKPKFVTAKDVESALDRRINVVLREIRKQGGEKQEPRKPGGQQQRRRDEPQQQTPTGPSAADVRDARVAYREYVADEITFLGNEERQYAQSVAVGLLRNALAEGVDPDDAGADVAKKVADQVKELRSFYTKRVVSKLRKDGRIAGSGTPTQRSRSTSAKPGKASQYQAGQAMAEKLYADRMKKTDAGA